MPRVTERQYSWSIASYLGAIIATNKNKKTRFNLQWFLILACKATVSVTRGKSQTVNGSSR